MQVVILIFWKYINGRSNLNQERLQNLENNQNNNSNPEIEMVDLHKLQDELKKLNAEHPALFASEPLISRKDEKFVLRLQQLDLKNLDFSDSIKSVSFLLHSEHGFTQAPYEEITSDQYTELVKDIKPITQVKDTQEFDLVDNLECSKGSCPVK